MDIISFLRGIKSCRMLYRQRNGVRTHYYELQATITPAMESALISVNACVENNAFYGGDARIVINCESLMALLCRSANHYHIINYANERLYDKRIGEN